MMLFFLAVTLISMRETFDLLETIAATYFSWTESVGTPSAIAGDDRKKANIKNR